MQTKKNSYDHDTDWFACILLIAAAVKLLNDASKKEKSEAKNFT